MTRTEEDVFLVPLRKVSSKRCLSPSKPTLEDSVSNGIKRKTQNGSASCGEQRNHEQQRHQLLWHNGDSSTPGGEHLNQQQLRLQLLYNNEESRSASGGEELNQQLRHPLLWRNQRDSQPSSDATAVGDRCWQVTGSARGSEQSQGGEEGGLPHSYNSLESTSLPWSESHQLAESRRSSCAGSQYSSSFTSWTRPEAGHRVSDSCVPNSSILDRESGARSVYRSRSMRKTSRKSSFKILKRDSSADTSKDIDDIEDFELDDGGLVEDLLHDDLADDEVDDHLLPDDHLKSSSSMERERKRGNSFVMHASPDLAYSSLNPSSDGL